MISEVVTSKVLEWYCNDRDDCLLTLGLGSERECVLTQLVSL